MLNRKIPPPAVSWRWNPIQSEEHCNGCGRTGAELDRERNKSIAFIERYGLLLRVDHNTYTAKVSAYAMGKNEYVAQQLDSDALAAQLFIACTRLRREIRYNSLIELYYYRLSITQLRDWSAERHKCVLLTELLKVLGHRALMDFNGDEFTTVFA